MKQIFLSYSTYDKSITTEIRDFLEKEGITCWMGNRDIPGGANYTKEITTAIRKCQVFLLILSAHSQNSDYVFRELDFAVKQKKMVVPYLIEDQELTDEFYFLISSTNGIHAFDDPKESLKILLSRLKDILRPNINFSPNRPSKKSGRKFIVCPRCRSGKLKNDTYLLDNLINNPERITPYLMAIASILVYSTAFLGFPLMNSNLPYFVQNIGHSIANISYTVYYTPIHALIKNLFKVSYGSSYDMLFAITGIVWIMVIWFIVSILLICLKNALLQHILIKRYSSGIAIYTFRCCQCDKKFRKKIPIREQAKYYIKEYVQED